MRRVLIHRSSSEADWLTKQALLYIAAFIITWTPAFVWSLITWSQGGGFWMGLLVTILEPLQGLWNLLIFLRNRPQTRQRIKNMCRCCFSKND